MPPPEAGGSPAACKFNLGTRGLVARSVGPAEAAGTLSSRGGDLGWLQGTCIAAEAAAGTVNPPPAQAAQVRPLLERVRVPDVDPSTTAHRRLRRLPAAPGGGSLLVEEGDYLASCGRARVPRFPPDSTLLRTIL